MDGDELFALFSCGAIALSSGVRWYGAVLRVRFFINRWQQRLVLALFPIVCLIPLQVVLKFWAAREVREGPEYDLLFLAGGAASLAFITFAIRLVGLSARDDALEARNPAAVTAVCGAWLGTTLCYTGANIGEGPTIWTTFAPAALAIGTLMVLWFFLELFTGVSESIAVDRDAASGLRLGGFLVAAGLILARAVAGNWVSWDETVHDFIFRAWPAMLLLLISIVLQRLWKPTPARPGPPVGICGVLPCAAFIAIAILDVIFSP